MEFHKHHNPPPKDKLGPKIMCLSKLMRQAFNEALSEQGLFSGQDFIILAVIENEGLTLRELAKILEVSAATASVSVKRMEKSGFIIKKPDEKDARITRLYPTSKAKAVPEIIHAHMDEMEKTLKSDMTAEQAEIFADLLEKAVQNILERGDFEC